MPEFATLVAERPPARQDVALVAASRPLLIAESDRPRDPDDDGGQTELWAFDGGSFRRIHAGLFPDERGELGGPPIAWFDGEVVHVGRFAGGGLRLARFDARGEVLLSETQLAGPLDPEAWVPEAFAAVHPTLGAIVHVCDNSVSQTLRVGAERLEHLCEGPYVHALASDGEGLVGYDVHGQLHRLGPDGRWATLGERQRGVDGLAWHPELGALVCLRPTDDDGMQLHAWTGAGFEPVTPARIATPYRSGGRLLVANGRVLYFGGQDFERGGAPSNATFVEVEIGQLRSDDDDDGLPKLGRYDTLLTTQSSLLIANHSRLEVNQAGLGSSFRRFASSPIEPDEYRGEFDDRYVNFAAWGDRVWLLDADGRVWCAREGGVFEALAGEPSPGPGGRYSGRVGLAWDVPGERLVAFGGPDRNDTWIFDHGWRELRPRTPPPHGIASMLATHVGIFALVSDELWALDGDEWRCVAGPLHAHRLLWDPTRDRLLLVTARELAVLEHGSLRGLAPMPKRPLLATAGSSGASIGLDPASDRVLILGERDALALELGALELDVATLPTTRIEPPTRRDAIPRPEWTRPAAVLERSGERVEVPRIPDLRDQLVALLPADALAMPLPGDAIGVAVGLDPEWYEDPDNQPWRLGGGGCSAVLIPPGVEFTPCMIDQAGQAHGLRLVAFTDLDPAHVDEVDTPPANQAQRSLCSKLGGYPRYIQAELDEDTDEPLRFVAQLGPDLFDSAFGDAGRLYLFMATTGQPRLLAALQSC